MVVLAIDSLHKLPQANDRRASVDRWTGGIEKARQLTGVTTWTIAEAPRRSESLDPFKESTSIKYGNDVAMVLEGTEYRRGGTLRVVKHRDAPVSGRVFSAQVDFPRFVIDDPKPRPTASPPAQLRIQIIDALKAAGGELSRPQLLTVVRTNHRAIGRAVKELQRAGGLIVTARGQTHWYRVP